jgi:hypothetical protein
MHAEIENPLAVKFGFKLGPRIYISKPLKASG